MKVSGRLITATIVYAFSLIYLKLKCENNRQKCDTLQTEFLVFLIVEKTTVEMYLHDGIESRLQTSEMLLFDLDTLLDLFL